MLQKTFFKFAFIAFVLFSLRVVGGFACAAQENDVQRDETALKRFEFVAEEMGVPMRLLLYAPDENVAKEAADAVWARFEELNDALSDYDPESEIVQVCRRSNETGERIPVSDDLRVVLSAAREYCELTDGAFDITVSPIVKLWRRSRSFNKLPPQNMLDAAKDNVGLDVWDLNDDGVWAKKNVRFDVGGIAKGVALDDALDALRAKGIASALIDASGDLRIGDPPPGKKGWRVGVSSLEEEPLFYIELSNVGIASSGDANRYVEIDGVRYSHIVDPRTGEPLTRRCVSSVLAPTATTADALASAICVLGPSEETAATFERIRARLTEANGGNDVPFEYALLQVKNDSEPPFAHDDVEVFASSGFEARIEEASSPLAP